MSLLRVLYAVVVLLLVGGSAAPAQTILYVNDDNGAPGDGTQSNPYPALQDAFDEVNDNASTDYEIRIAGGVYYPDVDNVDNDGVGGPEHTANADTSFTLIRDGVVIKGGYASGFGSRDPETNVTVLSGDVDGDDNTTDDIVETVGGISGTNSQHVLFLDGASTTITNSTVVDGVTITAGQAGSGNGGGMLCQGGQNGCSPQLDNVVFIGNQADNNGGGAYITADFTASSTPQITSARFENNQATNGGAVYNEGSGSGGTASPTFTDVVFIGNNASASGGAIYNNGTNGTASPTVRASRFTENTATNGGGAVFNNADAGAQPATASPTIEQTVFAQNTAAFGAVVVNRATASTFNSNVGEASPSVISGVFVNNVASGEGGAVYSSADETDAVASPVLTNGTVVGNGAGRGGAMYDSTANSGTVAPQVENTILWGNVATDSGDQVYNTGTSTTLSISYSIVEGGDGGLSGSTAFSSGTSNIDADPRFEYAPLPAGDDGTFGTDDDGLHVVPESPAIDDGNGTLSGNDVTGRSRTQNGTVDIGAYEEGRDQPRTIYVDASDTTPPHNGTSWATADTTLQSPGAFPGGALDYATDDDEIRVAEGVYTPSRADTSFTITGKQDGLTVKGGYDGTGARDLGTYPTVLSGDVDGDDDNRTGAGVTPTASDIIANNSEHVLVLDGGTGIGNNLSEDVTSATVIDGLTVTAGQANGSGLKNDGGGLHCDGRGAGNECSPTLRNIRFVGNTAAGGGAIFNGGGNGGTSSPQITNAVFAHNAVPSFDGGAITNDGENGTARPDITNAAFTNNAAGRDGGAIYNDGVGGTASPTISNTILWSNTASGGGDEIHNESASSTLSHSIVQGGDSGIGNGTAFSNGPDNLDVAPLFVDAANSDVRILGNSPALDAGDGGAVSLPRDIVGDPRTQNGTVDIGAYEGAASPSVQLSAPTGVADSSVSLSGTIIPYAPSADAILEVEPVGGGTVTSSTQPFSGLSFPDSSSSQSVSTSLSNLEPATPYEARLIGNDGTRTTTKTLTFKTDDTTSPENLTIDSPSTTTNKQPTASLDVTYSYVDATPDTVTIILDDGTNTARFGVDDSGYAADGTPKTESLDLSSPDAGSGGLVNGNTYDVRVTATDDSSNTSSVTAPGLVTIDNEAPGSVTLVSPTEPTFRTANQTLDVTYNYDDPHPDSTTLVFDDGTGNTATFGIDDSGYAGDGTNKTVTLDLSTPKAGDLSTESTYSLTVTAIDSASNSNSTTGPGRLTIDNTAPTVSNVTLGARRSPDGAFRIDTGTELLLRITSEEQLALGSSALTVSIDGPNAGADWTTFSDSSFSETNNEDGTYTYTLSTDATFSDGPGRYEAIVDAAADAAGNDGASGQSDTARGVTIDVAAGTVPRGTAADIDLTVRGGFAPTTDATLAARKGGASAFQELGLTVSERLAEGTPGTFRLNTVIPDSMVTTRGIDYYAQLVDGPDTLTVPAGGPTRARARPSHIPVSFEELAPDTTRSSIAFREETYRMVSVPAIPESGIKTALKEAYGAYDRRVWRLLRWEATENSGQGGYREYPALDSLKPGQGFWLVTRQGVPPSVSDGQTVKADSAYRMPLDAGWNQIANPFGFAVPWSAVQDRSGLSAAAVDGPFAYREGAYEADSLLAPWEAYFVFAESADTLMVPPVGDPDAKHSRRSLAKAFEASVEAQATKSGGDKRSTLTVTATSTSGQETVRLGLWPEAKRGRDRYDQAKPPSSVRETVSLSVLEEVEGRSVPHAGSAKPSEKSGGGRGQSWELRLSAPDDQSVQLTLSEKGAFEDRQAYLLDLRRKKRLLRGTEVDLKAGETRKLKAIVATKGYAAAKSEGIDLKEFETTLRSASPNPFRERATIEYVLSDATDVTIEVYDVLGRRIRTLVDEKKAEGIHRLRWDGKSRQGVPVGSGMYFVRMRTEGTTETIKLVRVR